MRAAEAFRVGSTANRGATMLLAVMVVVGCSSAPPDEGPSDEDAVEEVEVEPVADEDGPDDGEVADDEPAEDVSVEEVPETEPRVALGLPGIVLHTPQSGEGPRPLLTWEPVDGALTYAVTVYAGPEQPARWSWRGEQTSVRVGFVEDSTVGGPNVIDGMTWSVLALDADDEPVAQSSQRPIGP